MSQTGSPDRLKTLGLFLVILPGILAQAMLSASLTPGLPLMASAFGGGPQGEFLASLALTSGSLGLMLAGFGSGWLFDRMPPRMYLASFLIAMAGFGSLGLVLDRPVPLIIARVAAGGAACCLTTACMAFLQRQYDDAQRPKILGYQTAFGSAASIVVLILAGQLVNLAGWHASFFLYLAFVPALLLAWLAPQSRAPVPVRGALETGSPRGAFSIWPLYALTVTFFVLAMVPGVQGPYLMRLDGVTGAGEISALVSVMVFVAAISSLLYGFFDHRIGAARSLQLSLLSSAVGMGVFATAQGSLAIAAGMALFGFGVGFWTPYLIETVMRRNVGSSAFGVLVAALSFGIFINPVVFGVLHAVIGLRGALLLCATGLAAGAVANAGR